MFFRLDLIDRDTLAWWLCERQLPSGGLNGRPEKLPDVCYSWWVLSSLSILGRLHWIDSDSLKHFIFACQDTETGDETFIENKYLGLAFNSCFRWFC